MTRFTPFSIHIDDSKLHRLHQKLELADFPPELDEAGSVYGAPLSDVTRLAKYWKDGFNWREQEAKLNQLPQFTTDIPVEGFGELNIHFVHQKSDVPGAIPLLFIHGCKIDHILIQNNDLYSTGLMNIGPGSFIEATKLLPLLQGGKDGPAFHIVAPSLPNFGFSSRVNKVRRVRRSTQLCYNLLIHISPQERIWNIRVCRNVQQADAFTWIRPIR